MKAIPYLILASLFFFSCNHHPQKEVQKPASLIIGDPLECGIDNILIFPVGTSYNAKVYEKDNDLKSNKYLYFSRNSSTLNDRYAEAEFVNDNENDFDIRNILFYDMINGKSHQLISDTIHILSFAIHKEFKKPLIFYRIVKQDLNGDNKFNSADPVMLYVSELDGKNLFQITAVDEHFIDYNYYPKTEKILIKTILDSDADKAFSNADETNFTEMNLKEPAMAKEIFSKSLKDSLKVQIRAN